MPERACPFRCLYCNQRVITGVEKQIDEKEIRNLIERNLGTIREGAEVKIGFFGGTFTGLSIGEQKQYLEIAEDYVRQGRVSSITLSTRPDYIEDEIVDMLRRYSVSCVELGVQSMDDEVLAKTRRGYSSRDVERAVGIIRQRGIEVGMQMMIGLPGDTKEKSMYTAQRIINLGAVNTRIYPTLVIRDTELMEMWREGKYEPLTMEESIEWTKELIKKFERGGVTVLRVGLHPTSDFIGGRGYEAGPFHVSFREMVDTEIWYDKIIAQMGEDIGGEIEVEVNSREINHAVGYKSKNRDRLRERFEKVVFKKNDEVEDRECRITIKK